MIDYWTPTLPEITQTCHGFIAATLFLLCVTIGRATSTRAFLVVLGYALFKEYVFDILVEGDTWAGSSWDVVFYFLGLVIMWGVWVAFGGDE